MAKNLYATSGIKPDIWTKNAIKIITKAYGTYPRYRAQITCKIILNEKT